MGTEATQNVFLSPSLGADSAGVEVITSSVNFEKEEIESRSSSQAHSPKKNSISGESMENEVRLIKLIKNFRLLNLRIQFINYLENWKKNKKN